MANEQKRINLLAFDIENEDMGKAHSDLFDKLKMKLESGDNADTRRMKLNSDSPEEDLLSDYSINDKYIFGVIWRIAPSQETPSIPADFFKKPTIQINEIQEQEKSVHLRCKNHYYFALNKQYLVCNLPKSKIKSLQTYLNWLLEALRGDKLYKFTPKIKAPDSIKLSDIKKISFADPRVKKSSAKVPTKKEASSEGVKVFKFAEDLLKKVTGEMPALDDLINNKILKAQLLVKFSKPSKMDEEDYAKLLGAYMKPIGDSDGVNFTLNNGKKISGSNILRAKDVQITKIDSIRINEPELIQEMEAFLRELNKES